MMSDAILVGIISAVPPTIVALLALRRVTKVEVSLNGRLDQWLQLKGEAEHAAGVKEERDKGK